MEDITLISFIEGQSVRDGGEGSTAEGALLLLLLLSSFTARLQEQSALWRTPFRASSTPFPNDSHPLPSHRHFYSSSQYIRLFFLWAYGFLNRSATSRHMA